MNNNLESILSNYYYGPTDAWGEFVGAVEKWAREERADAWDQGQADERDYTSAFDNWREHITDYRPDPPNNPYRDN